MVHLGIIFWFGCVLEIKISPGFLVWNYTLAKISDTVDGRNPAPADIVNIPSFTEFYTSQVVSRISSIDWL